VGNRCADHVTPLYPQKLALTSPTGGARSVGIVRSRTKATEFSLVYYIITILLLCFFGFVIDMRTWTFSPLNLTVIHDFKISARGNVL